MEIRSVQYSLNYTSGASVVEKRVLLVCLFARANSTPINGFMRLAISVQC